MEVEVMEESFSTLTVSTPSEQAKIESQREKKQKIREKVYNLAGIPHSRFTRSYPSTVEGTCAKAINHKSYLELLRELITYHFHSNLAPVNLDFSDPPIPTKVSSIEELEEKTDLNLKLESNPAFLPIVFSGYIKCLFPELNRVSFGYEHGYFNIYRDDDIVAIHETVKEVTTEDGIKIRYTQHNKPIIQQQNPRGCAGAAAAMLILEHTNSTSSISMEELEHDYLVSAKDCAQKISNAELCPLIAQCTKGINWLAANIKKSGSALVDVNVGNGHTIMVDHISDTSVRLRDPYHAWEIEVRKPAFEKSLNAIGFIIQAVKKA